MTAKDLTAAICRRDHVPARNPRHLAYFEQASQTYLTYLADQGYLTLAAEDNRLVYRKAPYPRPSAAPMPPTGQVWLQRNPTQGRNPPWNWNSERQHLGAEELGAHPFYKVDDHHCVLLDTGLAEQREDLKPAWPRPASPR